MPEKTHYEGPRILEPLGKGKESATESHSEFSVRPTPTSGPTNGRRYGGPVWEWFDHPIGPIDSACLPKRIPGRLLDSRNLRQRSGGGGIGVKSLLAIKNPPTQNSVGWRGSLFTA